jgi:hypothetical protein
MTQAVKRKPYQGTKNEYAYITGKSHAKSEIKKRKPFFKKKALIAHLQESIQDAEKNRTDRRNAKHHKIFNEGSGYVYEKKLKKIQKEQIHKKLLIHRKASVARARKTLKAKKQ